MGKPKQGALVKAMIDESKEKVIRALLTNLHICRQCRDRVFACDFREYTLDPVDDTRTPPFCGACVGILEEVTLYDVASEVAGRLREHAGSTFNLGVSVPHCLMLKYASMRAHLDSEYTNVPTVKVAVKVLLADLVKRFTQKTLDTQSPLFVQVDFTYPGDEQEFFQLIEHMKQGRTDLPDGGIHNLNYLGAFKVKDLQREAHILTDDQIKLYTSCPPVPLETPSTFSITVKVPILVIAGRYNKYSREIYQYQSRKQIDVGVIDVGESVMSIIWDRLKEITGAENFRVRSLGYEEFDVCVLGDGRPFALELMDVRRPTVTAAQLVQIANQINLSTQMMAVHNLQVVDKRDVDFNSEECKDVEITYRVKLWCAEYISESLLQDVNMLQDIEVVQTTPIRYMNYDTRCHVNKETRRVKHISMQRCKDESQYYSLTLRCKGHLCVHEFIHGDFGRTHPSLKSWLSVDTSVVELDVLSVDYIWPPVVPPPPPKANYIWEANANDPTELILVEG